MKKKSLALGAFLGFFILGLLYSKGLNKQGALAVLGMMAVSYAVMFLVSPNLMWVVNVASAFLGYKWTKEHNEGTKMVADA